MEQKLAEPRQRKLTEHLTVPIQKGRIDSAILRSDWYKAAGIAGESKSAEVAEYGVGMLAAAGRWDALRSVITNGGERAQREAIDVAVKARHFEVLSAAIDLEGRGTMRVSHKLSEYARLKALGEAKKDDVDAAFERKDVTAQRLFIQCAHPDVAVYAVARAAEVKDWRLVFLAASRFAPDS